MKLWIFTTFLLIATPWTTGMKANPTPVNSLNVLRPRASEETQLEAVKRLIVRVLGQEKATLFNVNVSKNMLKDGKDSCQIKKEKDVEVISIVGSSGVAVAWGLNHYLKYYCNSQITWQERQIQIPDPLPPVNVTLHSSDRFRFYQNVCTWSYSMVWWEWNDWEQHLDWMALNGINLALAPAGGEEVWRRVYLNLGLEQSEIDEHFTGPAFLSWWRMGNMRGWGGPLTNNWQLDSYNLQTKILFRIRELGIIPVLPAFSGHVPRAFKRLFPNANLTKLTRWNHFTDEYCCPYLLSPLDPLFMKIGSMFLSEYSDMYNGLDHIYSSDTFNEMTPASNDLTYLKGLGQSIFAAMTAVDKDAIWMMQGWLFENQQAFWTKDRARTLLTSVPKGKILVLDLQADRIPEYGRLDNYFGQPYIWCMLHNFGGTLGLHGAAPTINIAVFTARNAKNSTMVGTGLTPEGIYQNYVIYDLMLELAWERQPVDLEKWFDAYSTRRYGEDNVHMTNAWSLLKDSVYSYKGNVPQHGTYILVHRPQLYLQPDIWYNPTDVFSAWDELLKGSGTMEKKQLANLNYDIVDVTRQSLQVILDDTYQRIISAYDMKDLSTLEPACKRFLDIMSDLDKLLATNKWFLLGRWISSAKARSKTPLESALYERNARNQITTWGPNKEIIDYANKQWSGLMTDYYRARWEKFFEALVESLKRGKHFHQNAVLRRIFKNVEQPFTYDTKVYPDEPAGDPLVVSELLHDRWRPKPGEWATHEKIRVDTVL